MNGELLARASLSRRQIAEMFELFTRHFEGVRWRRFVSDLDDKDWVIRLLDSRGVLVGFSTLLLYRVHDRGETKTIVYSGDTIVESRARRSSALSRTWIRSVHRLYREFGEGPLYWLLITSGYRTYRFLPVYFEEFFPRFDRPTPEPVARMIDRLAAHRFGSRYDPATGVVRFEHPQVLRPELRTVPDAKQSDPHVAFFVRANPEHVSGAELVCLAELAARNLTPAARRMVTAGRRRRAGRAMAS